MNPAPMPFVTALYAGLAGVLLVLLAARVSMLRRRHGDGVGDGDNRELRLAIRAHGNAVEWGVVSLLLLLVAELTRHAPILLHACGIAIIAGRVLHAIGLSRSGGPSAGRMLGSILSWTAVLVLSVSLVVSAVRVLTLA